MATITLRAAKGSPLTNTEVDNNFSALNTELATKANSASPSLTTPILGVATATSIAASLGAVGTPAYTFTGDTDTGMWSPAADTIAFSEGGVEAMRIDSSGNLGIGTSTPGSKLEVSGTTRSTALVVTSATASATTTQLTNLNSGFQLNTVNGSSSSASGDVQATLGLYYSSYLNGGIQFPRGGDGTNGWLNFMTAGTEKMRLDAAGNLGIGNTAPTTRLDVSGSITSRSGSVIADTLTNYGTNLVINAAGGLDTIFQTNGTERMRLITGGNVGIGTSAPGVPLDVNGATRIRSNFFVYGTGDRLNVLPGAAASGVTVLSTNNGNSDYAPLVLDGSRAVFNALGTERMRLDASGYLLVGTTSSAGVGSSRIQIGGSGPTTQILAKTSTGHFATYATGTDVYQSWASGGLLAFGVAPADGSTFTERMRIDSSGNVGIGTTSVTTSRVQVKGANNTTNAFDDGLKVTSANETVSTQYSWAGINANDTLLFATGGTERMRIASSGIVTATTSFNAPVFNDSNDSNYYTNPFGTSNLLGLTVANTITGSVTGSAGSLSNTTNYFINRGDIAAASIDSATGLGVWKQVNAGDSHTIIAAGAGGSTNTVQQRFHYTGTMEFRNNTDGGTWQPWKTVLTNTNYTNYSPSLTGGGASGTWGISVTGSSGSTTGSAATSGSAGALYANTGAVSSGLQVWNEISNTTLNPDAGWYYGLRMGHGDAATYYSATLAIPFFADGLYMRRKTGGTDTAWRRFWHNGDVSITAATDFQAPVFKDSDNAAFYLDPAGTSNLSRLTLNPGVLGVTTGFYINGGDITAARTPTTGAIYLSNGASSYIYFDGSSYEFGPSGFVTSSVSLRAPVFYNSPNTAFYVDPDATSVLSALNLGGRPTTNAVYYSGFSLDANTMDANSTGFTYSLNAPHTGPIVRLGDGGYSLQLNAPYSGNGNKLSYRTRQGDAGTFNSWFSVATYDVNPGSGELYATKFSDAANSAYYLNPDSTSALYDAIVIGPNPSWAAFLRVGGNGANSDMATVAASNGNLHLDSKNAGYHIYLNHSSNGNVMMNGGGGYAESYHSMRAPIFYDSQNTGFYSDPTSTSNLNAVLSYSYQGNGNVGSTGNASWHPSGVYSAGPNWLYGGIHAGGGDINNVNNCYASVFSDKDDSTYYLNPAGYSLINGNGSTAGSAGVALNIYSTGANGAIMAFHRGGHYAVNMGLDNDNVFRIGGWSAAANRLQMDMSGNLTMAGNVTAYSDARLKENIITVTDALGLVGRMRGVTYTRTDTGEAGVGVIAQEMLEVLPQVVQQGIGDDDTLSVAYGNIVGVLIEAIKELENEVSTIKSRLH
jgi:hypothetical protein